MPTTNKRIAAPLSLIRFPFVDGLLLTGLKACPTAVCDLLLTGWEACSTVVCDLLLTGWKAPSMVVYRPIESPILDR